MQRREVEENGTAIAYFLPETLQITGDVETQMLHRGIYDAAVFRAQRVVWSGKITLYSSGDDAMEVLYQRVNSLPSPFELEWHHLSGETLGLEARASKQSVV